MTEKETNSFWKSWKQLYNNNKSHLSPVVNGCSSKKGIADTFKDCFQKNSSPNNPDRLNSRFSESYAAYVRSHDESCDCKSVYITPLTVIDALLGMRPGKSADEEYLSAEHLLNAPLVMITRLSLVFDNMLHHAFVPS